MHRRASIAASLAALVAAGGAHAPQAPAKAAAPQPSAPAPVQATGVWDWVFRSTDNQGDVRLEQEEWHLQQEGRDVKGYYDRTVTLMSTDERLFRCNQRMGFTRFTRVRVAGEVEGERLMLRELEFAARPGPCDDGARNLVSYVGVVRAGVIKLQWAPDAGQTLHRREGGGAGLAGAVADAGLALPPASVLEAAAHRSSSGSGGAVAGTWDWELRSIDPEGDERIEREQWHLTEGDGGVGGWYERRVTRVRGDGSFTCNAKDRYETVTRYDVKGTRLGGRVSLAETAYHVDPSACDNGLRRLDTYSGAVSDDGDELVLSWGPGNQLLKRHR
jgi:hypothetical protein